MVYYGVFSSLPAAVAQDLERPGMKEKWRSLYVASSVYGFIGVNGLHGIFEGGGVTGWIGAWEHIPAAFTELELFHQAETWLEIFALFTYEVLRDDHLRREATITLAEKLDMYHRKVSLGEAEVDIVIMNNAYKYADDFPLFTAELKRLAGKLPPGPSLYLS